MILMNYKDCVIYKQKFRYKVKTKYWVGYYKDYKEMFNALHRVIDVEKWSNRV